jgi:hypothetical protein
MLRSVKWPAPLFVSVLVAAALVGCLCPPCPVEPGQATTAQAPAAAEATPAAPGGRYVIWDGETAGAAGKGWASCDKAPNCKSVFSKESAVGVDGTAGLRFHGEGPGWIGGGWNWFGWGSETAGTDLTPYSHFAFDIRVEPSAAAESAVDPDAVSVALGCSKGKQTSGDVSIRRYEKDFNDGKWHHVAIPIEAFTRGKGAVFDPKTAWEFRIFQWSDAPRNFTIFVDRIVLEKQ